MSSETRKQEQRLRRNESSRKSKQKKRDANKAILSEPVVDEPKAAMPCLLNPHAAEIDRQIEAFRKSQKWNTKIINTSYADFIDDFGSNVFTNFVQHTFTKAYLKKHNCADCGGKSENRCHGIGEERPILIRRALERVWPDTSKEIALKEIMVAFLEEHKNTKFALKCRECHVKEGKP